MATANFGNKTFGVLDFTNIFATEVDVGATIGFLDSVSDVTAGVVPNSQSPYIGLSWGGFNAGLLGANSSETITITFNVGSNTSGQLINGLQIGFTPDIVLGSGVGFTGVAQVFSGGLLVGQSTITDTNPLNPSIPAYSGSGDFSMYAGYSNLSVVYTLVASAGQFASSDALLIYSSVEIGFSPINQNQLANFGDKVFNDANGNGIQDSGETGVSGVLVKLLDENGNFLGATTTTNANGNYSFNNLNAGVYKAQFVAPTGGTFTLANQGGDDSLDSDVNAAGITDAITLVAGQTDGTIDAGLTLVQPTTITAFVFYDNNGNGIQEPGDLPASGVTVRLLDSTDTVIATTTTGPDGSYTFNALPGGNYQVVVVPPGGTTISTPSGSPNGSGDGGPNSVNYVNPTNGTSTELNVVGGQPGATVVAGVYVPASIEGRAFLDANANGIQENDAGISGVTVNLIAVTGFGSMVISSVPTDADGNYSFNNLPPGTYSIQFVDALGRSFSPQGVGSPTTDSDANPTTGTTGNIVLTSGAHVGDVDGGLWVPATLGGRAFVDQDADGVQESVDGGISGITVYLINPTTNGVIATRTTGADGSYLFTGLTPGSYAVEFVKPSGSIFSPTGAGTVTTDSDANTTTGRTGTVTLASGDVNTTIDAGLWQQGSIGNFVFLDANQDGIQGGPGETGISGVTVLLLNSSGGTIATTATTASGAYSFVNLNPGIYQVQFVSPSAYQFTTDNAGTNDATDSDADETTGRTSQITLTSGENDDTIDAGLYLKPVVALGKIGDYVFLDKNGNGVQDSNEGGISCVTVQLLSSTGAVLQTTVTDANGKYAFNDLAAGVYSVKFLTPAGYTLTSANQGTDDSKDSDAGANGVTAQVTLAQGQTDLTVDAGMFKKACIGDTVFRDCNGNGIQDCGEDGIACVTVQLLNSSGAVLCTTTTNSCGNYNFSDLNPGVYAVRFFTPTGYFLTGANKGTNDWIDSDAVANAGTNYSTTGLYTLCSGQCDTSVDAGFTKYASIGNFVWEDKNKNGVQDCGETGLSGVTVKLLNSSNSVIATTTTNAQGLYNFGGLTPGSYSLQFVALSGYRFTKQDAGCDGTIDSDANVTTGQTGCYTLSCGEVECNADAGMYKISFVSGQNGCNADYWSCNTSRWDGNGYCDSNDILYRLSTRGVCGPNGKVGLLLGDVNGNGRVDAGETTLFVSVQAAQQIISSSMTGTSDMHIVMMRQLITAQLNVYNYADAPGYVPGSTTVGNDLLSLGVKWLRGLGQFSSFSDGSSGNVDKYSNSGALDAGTSGYIDYNLNTKKLTASQLFSNTKAWTQKVDIDPSAGTFNVSGLDIKNAIEAFNANGTKLVTSVDGSMVGWAGTGSITNVQENNAMNMWGVLKSAGVVSGV